MKKSLKKYYKNLMFRLSAENSPLYIAFYRYLYTPRAGSLSAFIDYFSKNNPGLTVAQIGANDGFNFDPIHKFIRRDKWKGILLEPQKGVYRQLAELHKKSQGIKTVNAALDYQSGVKPIYKIAFSNERWATGLTTFSKETLEKIVDSEYVKTNAAKEGIPIPSKVEDRIKEEEIETIDSATLLNRYGIRNLTWLQVDAEGFDYEIIKMFNIAKTKPKVIVFEQYHLSDTEKKECYQLLKENGYQLKEYGRDALAVRDPEPEYQQFL